MTRGRWYFMWWGMDRECWTWDFEAHAGCCFHVNLGIVDFGYTCP